MAVMSINSTSPTFSHELGKNPMTGMQHRKVREGTGFGWFADFPQTYFLFFKEGYNTQSFAKYDFNYLTHLDCSSPFAYNTLITQFFKETLNKPYEEAQPGNATVVLEQVWFRGKATMRHLQGQMSGFNIDVEEIDGDCLYKLTISAKDIVISDMLKFVCVVTMFLSNEDQRKIGKLNAEFVERYARYFSDFDVPYFIRYMFSRNFFKTPEQFEKHRELLETENIKLAFGDTGQQRGSFIVEKLPCLDNVLDIGCGDGRPADYLIRSGKQIDKYYAVDIEDAELGKFKHRLDKTRSDTEFLTYSNYAEAIDAQEGNFTEILMTEVLEHMPYEIAIDLLTNVLNKANWTTALITVPNHAFNKHYLLEEGEFRHDDHDWEPTETEFVSFIETCLSGCTNDIAIEYFPVGDIVDGVSTSLGVRLVNEDIPLRAIICVGPSSSGKSTFASKFEGHYDWLEMNRDNIRFGYKERDWTKYEYSPQNERKVTAMFNNRMDKGFRLARSFVFSDTNLNEERNEKLVAKLKDRGYHIEFKYFDEKLPVLIQRNENRTGGIPYEAVLNQWQRFQLMTRPDVVELKEKLKDDKDLWVPAVCVDLDGTFFNLGERKGGDDENCHTDTVNEPVALMVKGLMMQGYFIAFTSGRREVARETTIKMLCDALNVEKHRFGSAMTLMMREEEDTKRDALLKIDMVRELVSKEIYPIAAIDDRKQVIEECWSLLDIPVFNVGKPAERF